MGWGIEVGLRDVWCAYSAVLCCTVLLARSLGKQVVERGYYWMGRAKKSGDGNVREVFSRSV